MENSDMNVWIPAITGLLGAFIGAISSFIPNLITEHYKSRREGAILKAALVAEIRAIVEIAEERRYLEGLETICIYLASTPDGTTAKYQVEVPEHYSRIYQANSGRIGLIELETAVAIITFHQFIDAVIQDVSHGGPLANGAELKNFKEAFEILGKAIAIGKKIGP